MDKWLFIEVFSYRSVNRMGQELGEYVRDKYDRTVVHADCMNDVADDIRSKMDELKKKYPRCKGFQLRHHRYEDSDYMIRDHIWAGHVDPNKDYEVFVLHTKKIRKLNLETTLNF